MLKKNESSPLLTQESALKYNFESQGRFIGCDVGKKTIGLALSDIRQIIASPLIVIRRKKWLQDLYVLQTCIKEHQVIGIIIGFPLNMNGSEGPRCQATRQFAVNILKDIHLPICLWDERLSTLAVTRPLMEANMSREKRHQVVDKMAASYILQTFLDARTHSQT